jgi:hypothetical protein
MDGKIMVEKDFKKVIDRKTLSELPYYLSMMDTKIFKYKQMGLSCSRARLKFVLGNRNYIRKRLLELLLKWKDSGYQSDSIDYNYVISKDKKQEDWIN